MSEGLVDTVPCGILVVEDDGTIEFANEALAAMVEADRSSLIGAKLNSILSVSSRIFYQTHLFPLMRLHGAASEIFIELKSGSGARLPVLVNGERRERGEETRSVLALIAVPERKRFEEEILAGKRAAEEAVRSNAELQRTKLELEDYAAQLDRRLAMEGRRNAESAQVSEALSHDLREPIRKVAWLADVLQEETGSANPQVIDVVTRLRAATRRADTLLHQLREYVSLTAAGESYRRVDLGPVAAAATSDFPPVEVEPLPGVTGIEWQLALMFRHIAEYLRSRSPGTATIRVAGSITEENVYRSLQEKYSYRPFARIRIGTDCPVTSPPPTAEMLNPLMNLRAHRGEGPEFGLALAGKIVDNHEGRIEIRSDARQGTCAFVVHLPVDGVEGRR